MFESVEEVVDVVACGASCDDEDVPLIGVDVLQLPGQVAVSRLSYDAVELIDDDVRVVRQHASGTDWLHHCQRRRVH